MATQLAHVLMPLLLEERGTMPGVVPYAVVGHSMGCWAAFETILELGRLGAPPPRLFLPSCFPAPDLPIKERPWNPNKSMGENQFKVGIESLFQAGNMCYKTDSASLSVQNECRGWGINENVLTTPHLWASFQVPCINVDVLVHVLFGQRSQCFVHYRP